MNNVLADLRSLLISDATVSGLVGSRIRCEALDHSDGRSDSIILELPYGRQNNCLSGEGIVNANVVVRARSIQQPTASTIANAVFNVLEAYAGAAGSGFVIQSERTELSTIQFDDDDQDNAGVHETQQLFSVWFQTL